MLTGITSDKDYAKKSYVIWGAGTQGRKPDLPLTKANHCANVVATANMSLPELMAAHFKPTKEVAADQAPPSTHRIEISPGVLVSAQAICRCL